MANATGQVQEFTVPIENTKIQWPTDSASNLGSALTFYPGEMLGVNAAGYAVHLDDTAALFFLGIQADSVPRTLDTGDAAGTLLLNVERRHFSMATNWSAAITDVGRPVYAKFNNLVDVVPGSFGNCVGTVEHFENTARVVIEPLPWNLFRQPFPGIQLLAASGAVSPNRAATYVVTKAGVAALTLAAPTATVDDGKIIVVTSATANAHTLTATGLLNTGTVSVNVATFAAHAGATVTLMAYQGLWNVLSSNGITFS